MSLIHQKVFLEIFHELRIICDVKSQKSMDNLESGFSVDHYFESNKKSCSDKLRLVISRLFQNKVPLRDITILSPNKMESSIVRDITEDYKIIDLTKKKTIPLNNSKSHIFFSTVQAYKGLENNHIIITDLNTLKGREIESLLYVAISRASTGLYMIMDISCQKEYELFLRERLLS